MMQPPRRSVYRPFGKYQPIRRLASGVVGVTYLAEGPGGAPVVLKLLYNRIAQVQRRLVRFYQEAKLAMEIDHPNLVNTLEVGFQDGRHFIAMKLAPGQTLRAHVEQYGALGEQAALRVVQQLSAAVEALHQRGIIHRDVNPDNALIDSEGHVVLVDLGLAKEVALPVNLTIDGGGLGDPQFIAPEQFRDAKHVGPAADIYGLAAMLSFLLTGKDPFPGGSPAEVFLAKFKFPFRLAESSHASVSPLTRALLCQAMSRSPEKRPASIARMHEQVTRCVQQLEPLEPRRLHSSEAVKRSLCTVLSVTETGELTRRELTEAQVAKLIKSGELTASARLAIGSEARFRPLAEVPQFAPLFRRPAIWKRAWQRLFAAGGVMRREVTGLGRGFWKSLRTELETEPDAHCGISLK